MQRPDSDRSTPHIQAQAAAAWTAADASTRENALDEALARQDQALRDAMREMQAVENLVGASEHILGSDSTKHGEIAEQVHVGVRRAFDVLHQRVPTATFEGVDRLAPVDYVDGEDIQSKYYDSLRDTLDGIASHAEQYQEFTATGGRYHMPRDQFEQLTAHRQRGTIDGLSERGLEGVRRRVESLQRETSRPVMDLIGPGEATYNEVQPGRVRATLQDRRNVFADQHENLQDVARRSSGPHSTMRRTARASARQQAPACVSRMRSAPRCEPARIRSGASSPARTGRTSGWTRPQARAAIRWRASQSMA